jgi:general secretion pathway protein I
MSIRRHANEPRAREQGFTLIEVLVALTILAVSLALLMGMFGTSLSRSRETQARMDARSLASALLAGAESAATLNVGETAGTSGPDLVWRVRVEPYGSPEDNQAWIAPAVRIQASVSWGEHGAGQTVSLSTLRLVAKARMP